MLARLPTTFCNLYYQETVALDPHLALNLEKALLVQSLGHVNGTLNSNFALEFPWMLHTHFIPSTSKFFLETIHAAYLGIRVYRDMCHRNQMSGFWFNEAGDSRFVPHFNQCWSIWLLIEPFKPSPIVHEYFQSSSNSMYMNISEFHPLFGRICIYNVFHILVESSTGKGAQP